ncbi:hypothetical protein C8Q78DRAFT_410170 [Trametes maxima]|nr:hypothetical protein C8Q78DRAFT_410170 [Trametes maxima]
MHGRAASEVKSLDVATEETLAYNLTRPKMDSRIFERRAYDHNTILKMHGGNGMASFYSRPRRMRKGTYSATSPSKHCQDTHTYASVVTLRSVGHPSSLSPREHISRRTPACMVRRAPTITCAVPPSPPPAAFTSHRPREFVFSQRPSSGTPSRTAHPFFTDGPNVTGYTAMSYFGTSDLTRWTHRCRFPPGEIARYDLRRGDTSLKDSLYVQGPYTTRPEGGLCAYAVERVRQVGERAEVLTESAGREDTTPGPRTTHTPPFLITRRDTATKDGSPCEYYQLTARNNAQQRATPAQWHETVKLSEPKILDAPLLS